jgi:hypothetical protein
MAIQNTIQPTTKVLAFTWHEADSWYGKNYRVVLLKEDSPIDFDSAKEAKQYRSKLARYINSKYQSANATGKRMVFKNYDEFPTYIHCTGPSYYCSNYHITVAELEAFITAQEDTYEFRQKQRELEWKRENRQRAKERKQYRREAMK